MGVVAGALVADPKHGVIALPDELEQGVVTGEVATVVVVIG